MMDRGQKSLIQYMQNMSRMRILKQVLAFFSLETLDTRLFAPTNAQRKQAIVSKASQQSRWGTLEFKIYLTIVAVVVPLMYKAAMDGSNEHNQNYPRFQHLLSQGWMFGRQVDNSDQQYRFFRDNLPMLCGLIAMHVGLRRVVTPLLGLVKRSHFDFGFGILFLFGAHGTNMFRILILVLTNYAISKFVTDRKVARALTWIFGISSLFINDKYRAVPFGISLIDHNFKGIIERWDVFFNFTLLRMISYNSDFLERKDELELQKESMAKAMEGKLDRSSLSNLEERERLKAPLPLADYNIVNYISYITYTPLFIAGPIITFNDYLYQSNYQQLPSVKSYKRTFIYLLRLGFCILVMEFLLHFMYVVAVSKTKAWAGNTPFQNSMLGLFNLNIIWLKLLIPWRLFRFWSLLDGIDPPENMIRCVDNNYSTLAFWRAWHRSYNKWVIRYIYVPLGGNGKYRILNSLLVFSFVAIWHDIELRLLMWGWMVVFFILPELIATAYFRRYEHQPWYRYLCSGGAVVNIWMMIIANLFGFCLGKEGTLGLLHDMFSTRNGLEFFVLSSCALFVGTQVMFEMREAEKRRGVNVKC